MEKTEIFVYQNVKNQESIPMIRSVVFGYVVLHHRSITIFPKKKLIIDIFRFIFHDFSFLLVHDLEPEGKEHTKTSICRQLK